MGKKTSPTTQLRSIFFVLCTGPVSALYIFPSITQNPNGFRRLLTYDVSLVLICIPLKTYYGILALVDIPVETGGLGLSVRYRHVRDGTWHWHWFVSNNIHDSSIRPFGERRVRIMFFCTRVSHNCYIPNDELGWPSPAHLSAHPCATYPRGQWLTCPMVCVLVTRYPRAGSLGRGLRRASIRLTR